MNNMQKAFKKKAGLKAACGMADGGTPTPHHLGMGLARNAAGEMRRRNRAIDNVGVVAPAPQPVAPVGAGGLSGRRNGAVPPAAMLEAQRRGMADGGRPTPHHLGMGLARSAAGDMRRRNRAIDNVGVEAPAPTPIAPVGKGGLSGRREGAMPPADMMARHRRGMMDGGEIEGPGGPTDDEAGLFALSSDEYVLPADTVDAMGGPEVLDEIRDATHDFVDPKKRGLANGGAIWDKTKDLAGSAMNRAKGMIGSKATPATPATPATQTPAGPNGDWSRQQKIDMTRAARGVKPTGTPNLPSTVVRSPANARGYALGRKLSRAGSSGLGAAARKLPLAAPLVGFGDYQADTGGIDTSAAGTLGYLAKGELGNAGTSLSGGAAEALADTGRGVSKFVDGTLGLVGLKPGLTEKYDKAVGGGYLKLRNPTAAAPEAAPAEKAAAAATPTAAQAEEARVSQELLNRGVSIEDQNDARFTFPEAQASSMRGDAGLGAAKNYRLGGGGQYDDSNADIFATSTRRDGRLNSFTGVGNANRPNWEQRNPADFKAATERAAADKARLRAAAVAHMQSGTADGLDMAYQLAAGDPEAQAAVEAARKEQGLRAAALNGSKEAAALLAQQGKDATDVQVANIAAGAETQKGLAAARSAAMKAQSDQRNSDREFNLKAGKQRREEIQADLEVALGGKQFDKEGNLNPAYADFMASLNETFLSPEMEEARGGRPLSLEEISSGDLQNFIREYSLYKKNEASGLGKALNFFTGNSFAPTADMMQNAAEPGTFDKGVFWNTYKTRRGELLRTAPTHGLWGDDLTADELRRFGGN